MYKDNFVFDLQNHSDEGYTVEQALDVMNGKAEEQPEPTEQEQPEEKPVETEEEAPEEQPEETETAAEEEAEEKPLDYGAKVKFKANGREQELSIQDLIQRAQLAENYDTKMQELAVQRKAFEAAMNQPPKPEENSPTKAFEEMNRQITARAMQELGLKNAEDFVPDATGLIGSREHFMAMQKAIYDIQQERTSQEAQFREYQNQEKRYVAIIDSNRNEPDVAEVNEYALKALFSLPQKGTEGIAEFERLYPVYQKMMQRDAAWNGRQVQLQPFTAEDINGIEKFFNEAKAEYRANKAKQQAKEKVPKSAPIKPTVKVENTTPTNQPEFRKVDVRKIRSMDIDAVAKLL